MRRALSYITALTFGLIRASPSDIARSKRSILSYPEYQTLRATTWKKIWKGVRYWIRYEQTNVVCENSIFPQGTGHVIHKRDLQFMLCGEKHRPDGGVVYQEYISARVDRNNYINFDNEFTVEKWSYGTRYGVISNY